MNRAWVLLLVVVTLAAASGCANRGATADLADDGSELSGDLLVFGAASLTDVFGEMKAAFEAANPGVDVRLNLAGSSTLREQILEGAPADVFASANRSNMEIVAEAGDIVAAPVTFATNRLQIAVPAGNPGGVTGLGDFANEELVVGLCTKDAPCGEFGREALTEAGVTPSIDTNEPNVRALLTKIDADELDAGLVYVTDVKSAGERIEGVEIPEADNVAASYRIAQLADAPNADGAAAFIEFVQSDEGQAILADSAFGPP